MWEFGPWKKGRYSVIFEGYYQTYIDLPRQGKIPLKLPEAKTVRLKYVSPEGWVGYSPPFYWNQNRGQLCCNGKDKRGHLGVWGMPPLRK